MSAHRKNGSFSGILLKQPPKFRSNKQNSKRNSIISISGRDKHEDMLLDATKRPRTEIAVKGNTSFNIRNTNNHAISRYTSAKHQQKYQQQLQNQLCSIKNEKNTGSQLQQPTKNQLSPVQPKKLIKIGENQSQELSLKLAPHSNMHDCLYSEHQKASTADDGEKVPFADKIEQMLEKYDKLYLQRSLNISSQLKKKKQKAKNLKQKKQTQLKSI